MDFNVRSLPVDVLGIAKAAGIRVIRDSSVRVLRPCENGKAYCDGKSWIIIYNDRNPTAVSRYTVAHELGHIFLGHKTIRTQYTDATEFSVKPKTEQQADMFAMRLLCPACILWALDIHKAEDICAYCTVSRGIAKTREKRMNMLYGRKKFLTDPLEQKLYDSFYDYINHTKAKQDKTI